MRREGGLLRVLDKEKVTCAPSVCISSRLRPKNHLRVARTNTLKNESFSPCRAHRFPRPWPTQRRPSRFLGGTSGRSETRHSPTPSNKSNMPALERTPIAACCFVYYVFLWPHPLAISFCRSKSRCRCCRSCSCRWRSTRSLSACSCCCRSSLAFSSRARAASLSATSRT